VPQSTPTSAIDLDSELDSQLIASTNSNSQDTIQSPSQPIWTGP
jgi:hypothetical protein